MCSKGKDEIDIGTIFCMIVMTNDWMTITTKKKSVVR
jgi:hypothetical protein